MNISLDSARSWALGGGVDPTHFCAHATEMQRRVVNMAAAIAESGEDAFRKVFKYYKSRNPLPDFSNVLDFSKRASSDKVTVISLSLSGCARVCVCVCVRARVSLNVKYKQLKSNQNATI